MTIREMVDGCICSWLVAWLHFFLVHVVSVPSGPCQECVTEGESGNQLYYDTGNVTKDAGTPV